MPRVGVSKFRIDLGIVHPDRPGDYLLGVECNGATYHSAATTPGRDKIRAAVSKALVGGCCASGGLDWWIDKQGAADRLHARIEERLEVDRQAAPEPAAPAVETTLPVDLEVPPIEPKGGEAPHAPSIAVATAVAEAKLPEPVYARAAEPVVEPQAAPAGDGLYRVTDFAPLASAINPERFYDPSYDTTLVALIAHVLTAEAPITEPLLVQRITRAHNFQRAGRIIRDRIMALAESLHHVEEEVGGGRFVWIDAVAPSTWRWARLPASDNDTRQIEEIALAELRIAATNSDPVEVARGFGIRRLSASARARIELA